MYIFVLMLPLNFLLDCNALLNLLLFIWCFLFYEIRILHCPLILCIVFAISFCIPPPPSSIAATFQSSLMPHQYGSCSEYKGYFHCRDQYLSCTVPAIYNFIWLGSYGTESQVLPSHPPVRKNWRTFFHFACYLWRMHYIQVDLFQDHIWPLAFPIHTWWQVLVRTRLKWNVDRWIGFCFPEELSGIFF